MGAKVTFNEITKIIEITQAPDVNGDVTIDVQADLYSDGKEDWVANENLRKFYFPIEAVGGNPLPGTKDLGTTFFLASDWKILPYNADHRLIIDGNLYSEDGSDPLLDTIGNYTVRVVQQVSDLVSTVSVGSGLSTAEHDQLFALPSADTIADSVWDELLTGATHNIATSAGRRLRQLGDPVAGSITDPNPTATNFITDLTEIHDEFFKDQLILFTTGNLTGFVRIISEYNGTTHEITVEEPCVEAPADGDEFDILPTHIHPMEEISETIWANQSALTLAADIKRILGLTQENFVMDQQIYDDYNGAKLLTSGRIRTYEDAAKTQLLATYQVTAVWSSGQCTNYQVIKQ